MTLGSLFDGSGGFPLAGLLCGIAPVWASEIEPYPMAVTRARLPGMRHLGDVTRIRGDEIEPVQVITFGSPCQDMSTAGKRAGMQHEGRGDGQTTRSGLFYEAVRIIRQMREATNGRYPDFAVWENVPGAFSSNGGEDFRCVLEELGRIADAGLCVPRPAHGRWPHAGEIVADGYSIAWRMLDAQYWGVPQRRRRIYLVADFRGQRAGKVLFERDGLPRDSAVRAEAGQGAAADAGGGTAGGRGNGVVSIHDKATRHKGGGSSRRDDGSANGMGVRADGIMYALDTACRHAIAFAGWPHEKAGGPYWTGEIAPTLTAAARNGNVPEVVYPKKARSLVAAGTGSPCVDKGQNIVVYDARRNGDGKTSGPLIGNHENRATDYSQIAVMASGQANAEIARAVVPTLNCDHEQPIVFTGERKHIVRRLTPLECCRLQGFPDWWEDGVPGSDSARYKMWGNGIALPCARFVLEGVAEKLRKAEGFKSRLISIAADSGGWPCATCAREGRELPACRECNERNRFAGYRQVEGGRS